MTQQALLAFLLTLASFLAAQVVQQSPLYTIIPKDGSISITCTTRGGPQYGVYLKQRWPETPQPSVIYYEDRKEPTVDKRFSGRIDFSGSQNNLTITMRLLKPADSALYSCHAVMENEVQGSGTMIVVTEKLSQGELQVTSVSLLTALPVGFFLIGLTLGALCMLKKTQIKKLCTSRDKNSQCVVYEDMSYSNRNAPCTPNHYH